MAEAKQRAVERRRCWLKALFVFNDGRSTLDAIARNVSDNGALLECGDMRLLPEEFDLIINMANGEPMRRRARQVWSHDGAMGVRFVDEHADAPNPGNSLAQAS
jgi:hypothetical protein